MAATGSTYHGGGHQVHWRVVDGGEMTLSARESLERLRREWVGLSRGAKRPAACVECAHEVVWWNGKRRRSATVVVAGVVAYVSGIWCRRTASSRCCWRRW